MTEAILSWLASVGMRPEIKLLRAVERRYFRTIDLFSGCGGMSLGFHRAGFKSLVSVEINDDARSSHRQNFERLASPERYRSFANITETGPRQAVAHLLPPQDRVDEPIDVVIGGPPCQAFSRLGRAALWRLAGHDHAHARDRRAALYVDFLNYVAELKPLAFVMENVREIGKFAGRNVAEEIAATAEELGYETRYTLLNAVWYGVPQLRERMFIVGVRKELGIIPSFPAATHVHEIPVGYSTSRAGRGSLQVLPPFEHYVDHAKTVVRPFQAVTAAEAFADLPPIYEHLDGRAGKGVPRDVNRLTEYLPRSNRYSKQMREWPDFFASDLFTGHIIRYTPRDYETFRRMPAGGMYPEALAVANALFLQRLKDAERTRGITIRRGSAEWERLYRSTVPPYKDHRYPNKFRKMWADKPARTLPAHLGKDSYSHIHYDSEQARCISLREAARLQSFPDAFVFSGSMNSQLTQIGNAVPPLLSYAVARTLAKTLIAATKAGAADLQLALPIPRAAGGDPQISPRPQALSASRRRSERAKQLRFREEEFPDEDSGLRT